MASSAFTPGDVVSLDFPYSDGADGKNRPAFVLAGPSAHGDYTVAMISRSKQSDGVAIVAADFASGSLNADSFVRVQHMFTCDNSCFVARRGALKAAAVKRILAALCPALGCKY